MEMLSNEELEKLLIAQERNMRYISNRANVLLGIALTYLSCPDVYEEKHDSSARDAAFQLHLPDVLTILLNINIFSCYFHL